MKKHKHLYLGQAGHLAVMSEFLIRGWNVATPEVDIGNDIFVVEDDSGILRRVQVKTSTAIIRKKGFSSQFILSFTQLKAISSSPIHYALITRNGANWMQPLIIRQDYLFKHVQENNIGTVHGNNLTLYISYNDQKITCSNIDFSMYVNDFSDFPILD